MPEDAGQLLGIMSSISDLFGGKLPIQDLYGPEGSHIYNNMMGDDRAEVDDFIRIAKGHPGPLLELAAGNGRTTLPLLEAGFQVTGLDSSPHMLQRLADKLREPKWEKYTGKLDTVESDMSDFSLGRKYGLVVLGMGTVWMLDESQRASLFRCVREHLTDDGRFLVTLPELPALSEDGTPLETRHVFIGQDSTTPVLCIMTEYFDQQIGKRLMCILAQRPENGAVGESTIFAHWNHLLYPAMLEKEVESAGLRVISQTEATATRVTTIVDRGRRRWVFEIGR
ncbi:daptide-type RiPP biosynthesis methyltransferase [Sphaerisporangium aureirubrum]|uniref:Daptide-type RiPP biosynthesis methyltransferase n=2 Tax=Sphaerisporangium aureirubrum TaxID=1544736 RepID=A0ABW1NV47_9ACTN